MFSFFYHRKKERTGQYINILIFMVAITISKCVDVIYSYTNITFRYYRNNLDVY